MFRGAAVPFAVCLVVAVVMVDVGPGLAAPPNPYSLSQQELTMSIIVNQLAILRGMNESTASSASHGDEVNQMREDMEEGWRAVNESVVEGMNDMDTDINNINNKIDAINQRVAEGRNDMETEVNSKIHGINESVVEVMNDMATDINNINSKIDAINQRVAEGRNDMESEVNSKIHGINESVMEGMNDMATDINNINSKIDGINQRVAEGMNGMEREINNKIDAINQRVDGWMNEMNERRMNDTHHIMEKLEAVQNAAADQHPRPGQYELYADHNDTVVSLCDGHKVLYGGDGYLTVTSSGNYSNNVDCSWTVTLPEGSRPVFRWLSFNIEACSPCSKCDYVYVQDADHTTTYHYCGDISPDGSFLTLINNKFKVRFHSDGSVTGRGFKLNYRAVLMD